jgi:hypothetical protein
MSEEITKAWAEFTKDAGKAKEDILSVFNADLPTDDDEGKNWIIFSTMGLGVCLVVALSIYMYVTFKDNDTNNKETKDKGSKIKRTKKA